MKTRNSPYELTDQQGREALRAYLVHYPDAHVALQFHSNPYPGYRSSEAFFASGTPNDSWEPTEVAKIHLSMVLYSEGHVVCHNKRTSIV